MKRGLVIGKFMPVHEGHVALIRFAAAQCDELIVSMSYTDDDPIDKQLRFGWLKDIFESSPQIRIGILKDDFDDTEAPLNIRTKTWAEVIRKTYPEVHIVFSSEEYGGPFASNLRAVHVSYDPDRAKTPVSASRIRHDPFTYWHYIPAVVRPHFIKKICFYGPESTGKSTMTKRMSEIYRSEFVPEVAREMLVVNDFTVNEIIAIGKAQTQRIIEKSQKPNKFLFCDTDLITTQIYSQHYLKQVPDILFDLEKKIRYEHYFLFDIDVPWIPDGLRDLGHMREEMFTIFKHELLKRKIPYTLVQGIPEERERIISSQLLKLV